MNRWVWIVIACAAALLVVSTWGGDPPEEARDGGADRAAEDPTPTATYEEEEEGSIDPPAMVGGVAMLPEVVKVDTIIRASVTTAPGFTLRYEWEINGRSSGLTMSDTLAGSFKRGDRIRLVVTPYKAGVAGIPMASGTTEVVNSPPVYVGSMGKGFQLDGHVFEVSDPDGDDVRFSLSGGPPGMALSADGELSWSPSGGGGVGGEQVYDVVVTAADGHGGEVTISFPVRVQGG